LTLNKNRIKSIYAKDGFRSLDTLAINDNLLDSWTSFDELNNFPCIKSLKASGNPITTMEEKKEDEDESKKKV
jgi:hypothetical protein